jgi:hypothetical protein
MGRTGTLSLIEAARKKIPAMPATVAITLICLLAVPYVMAKENWDDHDRSHRYTSRDFAYDYLNSCASECILFTKVITIPSLSGMHRKWKTYVQMCVL